MIIFIIYLVNYFYYLSYIFFNNIDNLKYSNVRLQLDINTPFTIIFISL